jgi:hypothetical protein
MIGLNVGPAAELPKRDGFSDGCTGGPMSQQDMSGAHGHEMYLQKFVRLVGCHEAPAAGARERDDRPAVR